jgi:catechol 2,3-dioxygenase-like lactoylglutathione lyase family enzyme
MFPPRQKMSIQFIDHLVFGVKDIAETEKFYSAFLGKPAFLGQDHVVYVAGGTRLFFVLPNKS